MAASKKTDQRGTLTDRLFSAAAVLAVAFIAFVAGAWVMLSETFPHSHFDAAYRGGKALWARMTTDLDVENTDFWAAERSERRGVTIHDPERAAEGLTLYTSGDGPHARLIDMSGELVHEWSLPYSRVWDESAAVRSPRPDSFMYWRKARLLPDGGLLAIYVAAGDTPWGYGMVRLDRGSRVQWKYLQRTHHDFDIDEKGNIYALTHEISSTAHERFQHLKPPHLEDYIVVLSPEGEEIRKVPVLSALLNSPYGRMLSNLRWYSLDSGDFVHTNAVEVIDADKAKHLPFAEAGQVLISMREINALAVIDLQREEAVWAVQGPWVGQHDPDLLDDGHILLFDNLGRYDGGDAGRSQLIEFDPLTMAIRWRYQGTAEEPFDSDVRAAQQRLDNGNTLITESSAGRIFEITREGDIVWEYHNPVRTGPIDTKHPDKVGNRLVPIVSWAQRIPAGALDAREFAHSQQGN